MKSELELPSWEAFLKLCSNLNTLENLNDLFTLFLTIEERETLASRYLIIKALLEGNLTQRQIAEKYHVSIAQITRGSNAIKVLDLQFRKVLEKKIEV